MKTGHWDTKFHHKHRQHTLHWRHCTGARVAGVTGVGHPVCGTGTGSGTRAWARGTGRARAREAPGTLPWTVNSQLPRLWSLRRPLGSESLLLLDRRPAPPRRLPLPAANSPTGTAAICTISTLSSLFGLTLSDSSHDYGHFSMLYFKSQGSSQNFEIMSPESVSTKHFN